MNRWLAARVKAHEVHSYITRKLERELYGSELVDAIIADDEDLECIECAFNDPLLGNEKDGYDQARYYAQEGYIVINRDLPDEEAKTLFKGHELGHRYVHTRYATCDSDGIDPGKLVLTLPYAEGRIATYHPQQMQEGEATIFAAELLVPSSRLVRLFDDGQDASELAAVFQVPRHIVLFQMATVLLNPPVDFVGLLETVRNPPFHWRELDESQRLACCATKGPVLVQAGPGTGKTQVLTSRVEWLIAEKGVPPERILALTFSNKASEELRFRLHRTVPNFAHQVTVATFHGFGLELLRRYGREADLPISVRVIDPVQAELLLEENLSDLQLVHFSDLAVPGRFLEDILKEIGRAKEALCDPDDYMTLVAKMGQEANTEEQHEQVEKCREVGQVYRHYNKLLREKGFVDYGDLVMMPVRLFSGAPELLSQLQQQYEHILVDEYQDINQANGELVRLIAGIEGHGLWAVGDLRQSIYRFRGASPGYIRHFDAHYVEAVVFPLNVNYRASDQLVEFANHVAGQTRVPLPKPQWRSSAGAPTDSSIWVAIADDKKSEMRGIGDAIRQFGANGTPFEDIAVLCRTNSQASEIARTLGQMGIPTLHLGKFFFRPEVKDLLAVLSLAVDRSGATWPRVAGLIREPVSLNDAAALWKSAREGHVAYPQAMVMAGDASFTLSSSQQEDFERLVTILSRFATRDDPNPWSILAEFLFEYGHYLRKLRKKDTAESAQALLATGQLLILTQAFAQHTRVSSETNSTKAFIQHVRRLIARDDSNVDLPVSDVDVDAVRVLTIHKSKGLEFPVVFIPNLAKQRFPPSGRRSPVPRVEGLEHDLESDDDFSDEERCLFVAMTRAKQRLILSRANTYSNTGKPRSRARSDLWRLLDLPLEEMGDFVLSSRWQKGMEDEPAEQHKPTTDLEDNEDGQLDIRAIKVFQRCPQQFFCRYRLGLAIPEERDIYLRFHIAILQTASWLGNSLAGDSIPEWEVVLAKLNDELEKQVPTEHVHASWYRREAEQQVQALWTRFMDYARKANAISYRETTAVEVEGYLVQLHLDEVIDLDNQRTVTHYKTGRKSTSHTDDAYLVLCRRAAAEGTSLPVKIYLNYLATGETIEVHGNKDEKIFAGLKEHLEKIRNGHFPPDPNHNQFWKICATCAYLFLCPKEA